MYWNNGLIVTVTLRSDRNIQFKFIRMDKEMLGNISSEIDENGRFHYLIEDYKLGENLDSLQTHFQTNIGPSECVIFECLTFKYIKC